MRGIACASAGVVVLGLALGCVFPLRTPPPLPTVPGPEAEDLASQLEGWIVHSLPLGGIAAIQLPGLKEQVVRAARKNQGFVQCLSGPDSQDRIAFIEESARRRKWGLKTIRIDGSGETEHLSGSGSPLWDHVVGGSIALGTENGRVAFLGACEKTQMHDPDALFRAGPITILDIETGTKREVGVRALDNFLAWLPDGHSVVCSSFLSKASGDDLPPLPESAGTVFQSWTELPAIRIVDVETGNSRFVSWGYHAAVSNDGNGLLAGLFPLVRGLKHVDHRLVDLRTERSRPVSWPGLWAVHALCRRDLAVFEGLPTEGTPVEYTASYSPLMGPRPLGSLKVVELSTQSFQTLIPHWDSRAHISFALDKPGAKRQGL